MNELPGPPLRIAVLGDFDGPHTRAWVRTFVERGHEVHAITYYTPDADLSGLTLHVLSKSGMPRGSARGVDRRDEALAPSANAPSLASRLPPSFMRLIHAWRYRRAGLRRVLDEIKPDVFHAHYAVEHGFYGAFAGYHPYVISAWGSDLLIESHNALGRRIAKWALSKADLVTGNDASLIQRAVELGVLPERATTVHLGIEPIFLAAGLSSVNLHGRDESPATIISDRALDPLYNVPAILTAFLGLLDISNLRLVVAGDGTMRSQLEDLSRQPFFSGRVTMTGQLPPRQLAEALAAAQVYVSVPSSDSLALSNLEAMAAGAFPIVSDLPSVDGWIEDGVNGLRVPPRDQEALINAIRRALGDPELRRHAAIRNRQIVEARGLREPNMLLMERHYYRLAGHPVDGQAI
jgi:glycosyltransferase involved in cell wall biosynthesis